MEIHKEKYPKPDVVSPMFHRGRRVAEAFAHGCGANLYDNTHRGKYIATYGIKYTTDEAIKLSENFWYMDNGYYGDTREYFRICYNKFIDDGLREYPKDRFEKFNITFKDWRQKGDHIVISPPSPVLQRFFGIGNDNDPGEWVKNLIKEIRQYTDRKIIVSTKYGDGISVFTKTPSKHPFEEAIKNAWALVTYNSNVMTKSLAEGIPVISLTEDRKIGSISEIETPVMNRDFLSNLAYRQWNLDEIRSGQAWRELNEI